MIKTKSKIKINQRTKNNQNKKGEKQGKNFRNNSKEKVKTKYDEPK